jgi:hypothetical protein
MEESRGMLAEQGQTEASCNNSSPSNEKQDGRYFYELCTFRVPCDS